MSTTTYTGLEAVRPARPSIWHRIGRAIAEGQQRRADAIVAYHLSHMDDETLAGLGWTPARIDALRRRSPGPVPIF
jgi:hypothetical protein